MAKLFALPWRFLETPTHPTFRSTQAAFLYEWLVLAQTSQHPKSHQKATASLSEPPAKVPLAKGPRTSTSSSQPRFTASFIWESPSPAQVAAISDCFIVQAGWPQAKHSSGLTLACIITQETPEPVHQWKTTDHIEVPPPYHCTADPPPRGEVGGHWSRPVLVA